MFVAGLIWKRMTSDNKISPKKKLHKPKRTVQVKRKREMRREKKCEQSLRFSEVKQNLDSVIGFVGSNPGYNNCCLMLRQMRLDVVKEQDEGGTETKISSCFKHGLNNAK
jgi:hypothetical protein